MPVMRIVTRKGAREEVVWGAREAKQGMLVELSYFPESKMVAVAASNGWSVSWLYAGDALDPSSWRLVVGGDALYAPLGWCVQLVILRSGVEGDRVLGYDGSKVKKLFDSPRPVDAGYAKNSVVALALVTDAKHRVVGYDVSGKKLWEYRPEEPSTVRSIEPTSDGFLITETGFLTPYRVLHLGFDGKHRVLEDLGKWVDAEVGEFWVKSFDGTKIHVFQVRRGPSKGAVVYWC